jgi:hypothetical protein
MFGNHHRRGNVQVRRNADFQRFVMVSHAFYYNQIVAARRRFMVRFQLPQLFLKFYGVHPSSRISSDGGHDGDNYPENTWKM